VIGTATNTLTATIPGFSGPFGVAVTPDGKTAYVTNEGSFTVSVISTATNTLTATITDQSFDDPGGWRSRRTGRPPTWPMPARAPCR
jgi:YVTN family beta-propeller protein